MIDGETDDIDFDWDQAQKELLNGAGIDMAKEMECKLLTVAEEVNDLHCFKPSRLLPLLSLSLLTQKIKKCYLRPTAARNKKLKLAHRIQQRHPGN